ncbi:MAG TPA: maleylpyruvate isomerase family mycothiol-dependent enzyme [Acidimicrobiales bacterium]|nr:maleylpyruvate isomerase family mycothiol-dependent enzyme [Acidimicrobiales bacterium]
MDSWTRRRAIIDASDSVAALITDDTRPVTVPSCPEWTLEELAWHLGVVQRFWAVNVLAGDTSAPLETIDDDIVSESGAFAAWCRDSTAQLIDALDRLEEDAPCWTWWGEPQSAGAVARHQVQEAIVHAWDAANALGVAAPLPRDAALDGVPEFLHVHRSSLVVPADRALTFHASDADASWTIGSGEVTTISANASDLVLYLHRRRPLEGLNVAGDPEVVHATLAGVDLS